MAVTLKENVYGFTGTGKKVRIGHVTEIEADLFPVGGKIFYIDPLSDEEVVFFDQYGDEIANVGVGDTPFAYKIIAPSTNGRDKYYVYNDAVFTSKRWTYYDPETIVEGDPRYDARWPGYAFESLGTSRDIGAGKSNTAIIMAKDNGAYVQANSNGYPTVMYKIKEMRDSLVGGCDDWFLPSDKELEELRKAIGFVKITTSDDPVILSAGAVTGGTVAGTADGQAHYKDYQTTRTCYPSANAFLSQYLWSSSEASAVNAWRWLYDTQVWGYNTKHYAYSVVGVRAF